MMYVLSSCKLLASNIIIAINKDLNYDIYAIIKECHDTEKKIK